MTSATDRYLDRCRELIATHGHMVQPILPIDNSPGWSYTVGLTSTLGFELVVFGLPQDVAGSLINPLADRLRSRRIEDGELIERIASTPLRLVTHSGATTQLGVAAALGIVPEVVRILQWPDTAGRFPGDPGYAFPLSQTFADLEGSH